jgi:hypothetical protein
MGTTGTIYPIPASRAVRWPGISTIVAHRHINELTARGLVVTDCGTDKGSVYSINDRYRGLILGHRA